MNKSLLLCEPMLVHITPYGDPSVSTLEERICQRICVSADLNFSYVGNKPTFRTKRREEDLALTFVNRCAWDRVVDWHVSNVPSFSDHMFIRFQVKSRIQKQGKMLQNIRVTC